jgi:hypothetical protein
MPVSVRTSPERLAIINYVVAADEIEAFTLNVAQGITTNASLSIALMKEQLRILAGAKRMSLDVFERVQACVASATIVTTTKKAFARSKRRSPLFHGD